MHIAASPAWQAWSELSTRFPADLDLNALARSTGAVRRVRGLGIGDGETLLRLCLAHGPGGMSLQETAAWADLEGVAELTAQSLNERLHGSVGFLSAVLHQLLVERSASQGVLWRGRCLRVADGSSISQPGSKGTDWRLHGVYDLGRGGFSHLEVTDQTGAESLLRCDPVDGEVLIADRGYAKAKELWACLEPSGAHRRDFIVRVGWKALALRDPAGAPFNLIERLQAMPLGASLEEWVVQAVVGSGKQPRLLPIRLIAVPLPPDKAEANRRRLRKRASKHQEKFDPRSLIAAGFIVLATSLPTDVPANEICAAYRLRWQIELAIKRLKSLLDIGRLPTRTRDGSLAWLLAHLVAALLVEDVQQDFLESSP
jgi:hypothetical protein